MKQGDFGWKATKKIQVVKSKGMKKVLVKGNPYMSWLNGDEAAERMAIVQLYELGLGTQEELAGAFQRHVNSVAKYISIFKSDGASGLVSQDRGPKQSWKLTPQTRARILFLVLHEGIKEYTPIQKRLEDWNRVVSIESIRQVLMENGLVAESIEAPKAKQRNLFEDRSNKQLELGFSAQPSVHLNNPGELSLAENNNLNEVNSPQEKNRSYHSSAQRIYLDQLEQGQYSTYAGGLLFVPLLQQYNFLPTIERIINIETYEGYSLGQLCLTLFYFDLFRFQSMEDFKTVYPEEFGLLVGKSSSPSIFTLRRFLHKVKELEKSEELIDEFAKEYLTKEIAGWGVLYIDSHFLPYFGIYPITMGWHAVRKEPMKGSYNFLAVDEGFSPLLFLIRPSSEDLLQKIPEIILKAKKIAKEIGISDEDAENLTVIFDREGYSAELFRILDAKHPDDKRFKTRFISWAKYADKWVNDIENEKFDKTVTVTYQIQEPETIEYFETEKTMKKYGKMRAIVIQSGRDKKRVAIYTNDNETQAERIVQLICRRWGEENLIKELMTKHLINYSPGYEPEEIEEQPLVENPKVKELKQKRANLKTELSQINSRFGHEVLEEMAKQASWDEIKKKRILTIADIESIRSRITLLNQEIDKHPEEIKFDEAHGKKLLELNYEKKRFLDCIKVFTYNMEKKMCELLSHYYDKEKEIQPALAMIVRRGGNVKLEDGRLSVRLRRFKNLEIDYAARHLCEDLNKMEPCALDKFHLPIHYEVA